MNGKFYAIRLLGFAAVFLLLVVGCDIGEVGEVQTDSQSVEAGAATEADVEVTMAAGELVISGGAGSLMQGDFQYNIEDWAPAVNYTVSGNEGVLVVNHADNLPESTGLVNEWNLQFSNDIPMSLDVSTGAGESDLNLAGIDLTSLQVNMGAGSAVVDLSQALDHDLTVSIDGGVGEVTVMLPEEMGVQVSVDAGIGDISTIGLTEDGDNYVNEAYGTAENTLFLEINAGVGQIELVVQ